MVYTVFGLFLIPLTTEFNWSRGGVSFVLTIISVASAIGYPVVGRLIDRHGARRIILAGNILFAASIASVSLIGASLLHLYLAYALVGLTAAIPSSAMFTKVIASWFDRNRGLFLGIVGGFGNGVGAAFSPVLAHLLISAFGWRGGFQGIALTVLAIGFPVLFLLLWDPPKSTDKQPDKRHARASAHPIAPLNKSNPTGDSGERHAATSAHPTVPLNISNPAGDSGEHHAGGSAHPTVPLNTSDPAGDSGERHAGGSAHLAPLVSTPKPTPDAASIKFGTASESTVGEPETTKDSAAAGTGMTLGEALRTGSFWIILIAIALGAGCMTGIFAHIVPMLEDRGLPRAQAATVLATFSMVTAAWQIGVGYLLDRVPKPWIAAPFYAVALGGLVLLQSTASFPLLLVAGLLLGFGLGTEYGVLPYFISRYFGVRHYGSITGTAYSVVVLTQGVTPFLMGLVFDRTGNYDLAITAIALGLVLGIVLILRLRPFTHVPSPVV